MHGWRDDIASPWAPVGAKKLLFTVTFYSMFHVIGHQENYSCEHVFWLLWNLKIRRKLLVGQKYTLLFFSGSGR